jgi:hypothetical protein
VLTQREALRRSLTEKRSTPSHYEGNGKFQIDVEHASVVLAVGNLRLSSSCDLACHDAPSQMLRCLRRNQNHLSKEVVRPRSRKENTPP